MGYFSRSTRTLIGPAVDEAANFYENADWIGVSISPSTRSIPRRYVGNTDPDFIVEYHIPQTVKDDKMIWAANWTKWDPDYRYYNILNNKAVQYSHLHEYRKYIKYKNTLDFYSACSKL